jgi:hypothetical protein
MYTTKLEIHSWTKKVDLLILSEDIDTHPAIITIPPRGVIGPRSLKLCRINKYSYVWAFFPTYRSRASINAMMLVEKIAPPAAIAGAANLCFENRG